MSTRFSAHPALASEHLQSTEPSARHHRRHHSAGAGLSSGSGCGTTPKSKFYSRFAKLSNNTNGAVPESASSSAAKFSTFDAPQKTLPVRTAIAPDADADADADADGVDTDVEVELDMDDDDDSGVAANNTKDCVDCAPPSANDCSASGRPALSAAFIDEPDHLQYRFSRTHHSSAVDGGHRQQFASTTHHCAADMCASSASIHAISDGCISGLSSSISSPSASTVSSPLSTPTRLPPHFAQHGHQHCCQQAAAGGDSGSTLSHLHLHHHQHQHHHHHHHHASSSSTAASSSNGAAAASGCKKLQKFDPRLGPSRYRQLLPILLCILSFAIVFSILIVYMDTTEIRHKQFRLNMSRDSEWFSVAQDDPTLIAFLREIHMRKYPLHFLKNARDTTPAAATAASHFNFSAHYDGLTPEMAHYVAELVGGKMNGAVIQSLPGTLGHLMTAPWLAQTLNWAGVVVEPQPRRFFTLLKQNAQRPRLQVVHACVSPNPYPKEVTIHNEESEVRINSLLDEETSWFNSRVKCFPLYSIMLACNRVEYDLLSLGVHGHELEVLQTLPFDKIRIEVISIHLPDDREDLGREYIQMLTKFLMGKSYKLQKRFGRNYFYQRINTTSRTRKKDILLLKTP